MGFNVSGLVVNKNYKENFESLQKELGWNLEKQADITFETASSNWKDDGICDVYFSDKGTLLFISMEMCTESWGLKNDNILTFALSETSMAFILNYVENGVEKRSIMAVNDDRMKDKGDKLEVESKSDDISEIIWKQMEVVLGKSFWSIDPAEKAERYIFVKDKKAVSSPAPKAASYNDSVGKLTVEKSNDLETKYDDTTFPNLLIRTKALSVDIVIVLIIFTGTSLFIHSVGGIPNFVKGFILISMLYLYDPLFTSLAGGTLGHKIMKLKVSRYKKPEKKISLGQAFVRSFIKGSLGWISFLTVTSSKHKRAIHDLASGSIMLTTK